MCGRDGGKVTLNPPSTYDRRQGGMPLLCQGAPQQRQHISISAARSKSVWRIRSEVSLSWILPVETGSI